MEDMVCWESTAECRLPLKAEVLPRVLVPLDFERALGEADSCDGDKPCSNCHNCEHGCKCATCNECDEHVDSVCSRCDNCTEHCECYRCNGCSRLRASDDRCEHCEECERCCTCSTCQHRRCGQRVEHVCERCEYCEDHCGCSHCESCNEACEFTCGRCNSCESCCECARCSSCSEMCESTCEHCDECSDCCDCNKVGDPVIGPFDTFPVRRTIGIEWETKKASTSRNLCGGAEIGIHSDSSIDGDELVTPPLAGDAIQRVVNALATWVDEVDKKCSVHVHVYAKDLSPHGLLRLVRVHQHIERVLYALAGQHRRINSYCEPIEAEEAKTMSNLRDAYGAYSDRGDKKDGNRYKSLNLVPVLRGHATVEYRMHRDTDDPKRVGGWARLCCELVEWAHNADSAAETRILGLHPMRALREMAPHSHKWIAWRLVEWRQFFRGARRDSRLILDREPTVRRGRAFVASVEARNARVNWYGGTIECAA